VSKTSPAPSAAAFASSTPKERGGETRGVDRVGAARRIGGKSGVAVLRSEADGMDDDPARIDRAVGTPQMEGDRPGVRARFERTNRGRDGRRVETGSRD
jgi:hypothetical protein